MTFRFCYLFASLSLLATLFFSTASAQTVNRPANDNFANRRAITGLSDVTGTTVGATLESWEYAGIGSCSVWYDWTAPQSGIFSIRTNSACRLQIYEGATRESLGTLSYYDADVARSSPLAFKATAGVKYPLRVESRGLTGIPFTLKFSKVSAPANDDFVNALTITQSMPVTITGNNLYATAEKQEPFSYGGIGTGGHSLWYKWTASETGDYQIWTGTNTLAYPLVFKGATLGTLKQVDSLFKNDAVEFKATAGETFYLSLNNLGQERGAFAVTFRRILRPVNDDVVNATVISPTVPTIVHGSNINASHQRDEPWIQPGRQSMVWYTWTPSVSGVYNITPHVDETMGEGWLTVFVGNPKISDRRCKLYGEDHQQFGPINFSAMAGITYYISIDGLNGAQGNFRLELSSYAEALADGGEVVVGKNYDGQQADLGKEDVWTFWGEKDEMLYLKFGTGAYVKAMPRLQRFSIRVEDEAGNLIAEVKNADGSNGLRTLRIPKSGIYSIKVKSLSLEALGRYSFTLRPVAQESFIISRTGKGLYAGRMDEVDRVHRWTFWGKAGQQIAVELLHKPDYMNGPYSEFSMRLVGPNGWVREGVGSVLPVDGEYTVEVYMRHDARPVATGYTLRVWAAGTELPVPAEPVSVVRDDVGNTRVALNFKKQRARWVEVQTSTDLENWAPVMTFRIAEGDSSIDVGSYPDEKRFFRVVPASAP